MNLKEFKDKINEMYDKYGDIEVCFDFKTGGEGLYSFSKDGKLLTYDDNENTPDDYFDYCFIEEIIDIQETYFDEEQTKVSGICLSNYKQSGEK